jgi:calcineurin-like phosphoesterase family protein
MRWFTSDTHFGHKNILKYEAESRPFDGTDEMDETIIQNWNAVVAPGDIVFHLGDVAMGDIAQSLPKVSRLNGIKILIPGNHDRVWSGTKNAKHAATYNQVFSTIAPEQMTLELQDSSTVALCHFPYTGDHTTDDRYPEFRPVDNGLPLIHGHVHSLWHTNGRQFNVGVDVNALTPVSEDEIINWVNGL